MGSTQNSGDDDVASLRRALNGLRREHRELKEEVEDKVLAYLEEERDVMEELDTRVGDIGFLIREITKNRERLDDMEEAVEGAADATTVHDRLDGLEERLDERLGEKDAELLDRVKKLETRVDALADAADERS